MDKGEFLKLPIGTVVEFKAGSMYFVEVKNTKTSTIIVDGGNSGFEIGDTQYYINTGMDIPYILYPISLSIASKKIQKMYGVDINGNN